MWNPLGGVAGRDLLHHLVDLLEGESLGLWNHEVGKDDAGSAERAPDPEDLGAEVAVVLTHHVWGDSTDDAVPEPVGCSGHGNTLGTDWQREDLTDGDPGGWTPGGGEEEDVDADKCDHCLLSHDVLAIDLTDNGHDVLAKTHSDGTPDEQRTTSELLNGVEGDWSRADVDDGGDHGDQEWVLEADLGEEDSTKSLVSMQWL